MTFKKLKTLLLIGALLGTILCSGQTDTGKVCLTYPEFDFYAEKLVIAEGLKRDTSILYTMVRKQDSVHYHTSRELSLCKQTNNTYSLQVQYQNGVIADLTNNLGRSQRWVRAFKRVCLATVVYSVAITTYIVLHSQ